MFEILGFAKLFINAELPVEEALTDRGTIASLVLVLIRFCAVIAISAFTVGFDPSQLS